MKGFESFIKMAANSADTWTAGANHTFRVLRAALVREGRLAVVGEAQPRSQV